MLAAPFVCVGFHSSVNILSLAAVSSLSAAVFVSLGASVLFIPCLSLRSVCVHALCVYRNALFFGHAHVVSSHAEESQ